MAADADHTEQAYRDFADLVLRALHERKLDEAFKNVEAINFDMGGHIAFLERVIGKEDRSAAILLYSYFDDLLLDTVKQQLGNHADELCGPNRPLAPSRPRIILAEGLGWITPDVAHSVNIMRKIRNEFAHNINAESFDDNKCRGWISSMNNTESRWYQRNALTEEIKPRDMLTLRELYFTRAINAVCDGIQQILMRPMMLRQGLRPEHEGLNLGSKMPSHYKGLTLSAIYATYLILSTSSPDIPNSRAAQWRRAVREGFAEWVANFDAIVDQELSNKSSTRNVN